MSSSYYRKCKHCGRRIQMRKMPHGKYVAFEGYDTVHDCKKPVKKRTTKSFFGVDKRKDKSYIDTIEIPSISLGKYGLRPPKQTASQNLNVQKRSSNIG